MSHKLLLLGKDQPAIDAVDVVDVNHRARDKDFVPCRNIAIVIVLLRK